MVLEIMNNIRKYLCIITMQLAIAYSVPVLSAAVDDNGNIVPDSRTDAENKVNEINDKLAEKTQEFINRMLVLSESQE